jgi:hypothetical protein
MDVAKLILEYLKLVATPQAIGGAIALVFLGRFREEIKALIRRIASIKLPGGTEVSMPQLERIEPASKIPPALPPGTPVTLPEGLRLTPDQVQAVTEIFRAERAAAHLWEYRFLNYFLVHDTQRVLDWLASLPERTTFCLYDAWWLPTIPSAEERRAIMRALEAHNLVVENGPLLEVTPKGREYIQWRGSVQTPAT